MKKPILLAVLVICALSLLPLRAWATYQIDDGTAEDSLGITGSGTGADLIALNHFTVTGNMSMIMSVSIAWGNTVNPDPTLNGLTYTAVIWNDINGLGNPLNATVLATASGVITNANTNTFDVTLFPNCPQVTNSFFVGFIITQRIGQFPAAIDLDPPSYSNQSFIGGSTTAGGGDIYNLGSPNNDLPVLAVENYGFDGNFLIRADPCAVPEPSAMSLLVIGGLAGAAIVLRRIGLLPRRVRNKKLLPA